MGCFLQKSSFEEAPQGCSGTYCTQRLSLLSFSLSFNHRLPLPGSLSLKLPLYSVILERDHNPPTKLCRVACFPSAYFKHRSQRMVRFLDLDTSSRRLLPFGSSLGFHLQMSQPLKCDRTKFLLTRVKQGPWLDSGVIHLFDMMYVQCISIQFRT